MLPHTNYEILSPDRFPLAKEFLQVIHKVLDGKPVTIHIEIDQEKHHPIFATDPNPTILVRIENPSTAFNPVTEVKYESSFLQLNSQRLESLLAKEISSDNPWLYIVFEGKLQGLVWDACIRVVHKIETESQS